MEGLSNVKKMGKKEKTVKDWSSDNIYNEQGNEG